MEPELAHSALQLVERRVCGISRQGEETGEAPRMFLADGRDGVVGDARERYRPAALETVGAGRGDAQDLDVDAEPVHVLDARIDMAALKGRRVYAAAEFEIGRAHV